ncbi:DNA-binding protein WhiA [Mycoplasmopsis iners]|uniref:DNA-binding protein WhiA n=1 Tax=Mycoplasmopsis iners TaxID=76630 RepID=UPI0004965E2E|nr:DNA-binding protein WhiA [Mycoplasmopsis iners]
MNFSLQIKHEIIERQKEINEIKDFIKGFIFGKGFFDLEENVIVQINDPIILQKFTAFLKKINLKSQNENKNLIIHNVKDLLNQEIAHLGNFFAGLFCATGTISNLDKTSYHLSMSSNYEFYTDEIIQKLNKYDFNFTKRHYKKKYLLYIKRQEKIADFLKAIEAINSFLTFEDSIITRDYDNNINRLNNIDFSNINKMAEAHKKYVQNINFIEEHNLTNLFEEKQLLFFNLIKNNPGESLGVLANMMSEKGYEISKSGVNHWLRKLQKEVEKYKLEITKKGI